MPLFSRSMGSESLDEAPLHDELADSESGDSGEGSLMKTMSTRVKPSSPRMSFSWVADWVRDFALTGFCKIMLVSFCFCMGSCGGHPKVDPTPVFFLGSVLPE